MVQLMESSRSHSTSSARWPPVVPETQHAHGPDVTVCAVAIDRQLNNHGGTVRGQVDAGEGLFEMTQRRLLHQRSAMASTWMRRSTFILKP